MALLRNLIHDSQLHFEIIEELSNKYHYNALVFVVLHAIILLNIFDIAVISFIFHFIIDFLCKNFYK